MDDTLCINSLALAYLGDSIYEFYVRKHLIRKGILKVNVLQKNAILYVSTLVFPLPAPASISIGPPTYVTASF